MNIFKQKFFLWLPVGIFNNSGIKIKFFDLKFSIILSYPVIKITLTDHLENYKQNCEFVEIDHLVQFEQLLYHDSPKDRWQLPTPKRPYYRQTSKRLEVLLFGQKS
jgi:pyruvate-formate lyase-activating enzyme